MFRILLVEDDPEYSQALEQMYRQILGKGKLDLEIANDARSALSLLKRGAFDLVSLDINLAGDATGERLAGADGRSVLREARRKHACGGIIIITAAADDPNFATLSERSGESSVWGKIRDLAQEHFRGRAKTLLKNLDQTPRDNVAAFRADLRKEDLLKLCGRPSYREGLYVIEIHRENGIATGVRIKASGGRKGDRVQVPPPYAELLAEFFEKTPELMKPSLTQAEIAKHLQSRDTGESDAKRAGRVVDNLKRWLKSRRFNPEEIVGKIGKGEGYEILCEVLPVENSSWREQAMGDKIEHLPDPDFGPAPAQPRGDGRQVRVGFATVEREKRRARDRNRR